MTFVKGTATDYQDLLTQLKQVATGNHLATIAINAAGTGYTAGDILTVSGGTFTHVAKIRVTTVGGGGAITGAVISEGGAYTSNPSSPVSVTGGTGSAATFTSTFTGTGWTTLIDMATWATTEKVLMLQGNGSGSDTIYVGITTLRGTSQENGNSTRNWGLWASTGYNSGLPWYNQPGISPGFSVADGSVSATGGAYVPLKPSDAFNMTFWFSITGRRIIGAVKVQSATTTYYPSFYLGWMNPFGTSTEFPYPIFVEGSTARPNSYYTDSTIARIGGLTECIGITGLVGPAFYLRNDSVWKQVKNTIGDDTASPSRSPSKDAVIYPCGQGNIEGLTEEVLTVDTSNNWSWDDLIPGSGVPGSPLYKLQPTPDGGAGIRILVPSTVMASDDDAGSNDVDILGDLDLVYWFTGIGGVTAEDHMDIGTDRYRIFPCGNRLETTSFFALREA